ncbi:MAG: adenylate/guanylate cyclase domain-containing protein [Leptospirales bacterium]
MNKTLTSIADKSISSQAVKLSLYWLDPSNKAKIQSFLENAFNPYQKNGLVSPIITIISEFLQHSIILNYRYVFEKYMIDEFGWGDLPRSEWIGIFEAEIDSNKIDNFTTHATKENLPVEITLKPGDGEISISISHNGIYNNKEIETLKNLMTDIKKVAFEARQKEENNHQKTVQQFESGLPFGLLCFQGLGLTGKSLRIFSRKEKTHYSFHLPFQPVHVEQKSIQVVQESPAQKDLLWNIFEDLKYDTILFDTNGNVLELSPNIIEYLQINNNNLNEIYNYIPDNFFQDIFYSPFSVHNFSQFANYRLTLNNDEASRLFNISGVISKQGQIATLWQPVNIESKRGKFSEGSFFENFNLMKIVEPYIPKMVLSKARETIRKGNKNLPIENKVVTVMFADLVGFTRMSESLPHKDVMDLLNQAMKIIVTSIERNNGYVDKFIGDGIMNIFAEPADCVISALEIQNNFMNLNVFRKMNDRPSIEARIGINTGNVILGSVGSNERMDWTALGDVVNTAARIETQSEKNKVLVGKSTFDLLEGRIGIEKKVFSQFKGKNDQQELFFINKIDYTHDNIKRSLSLEEIS